MLSCHLCWRRYISSLASIHLPPTSPALRRSYAAAAVASASTSEVPPFKRPPPRGFKPRQRPLLDQIALSDPAKLADTVRRRLATGENDAALSLTRSGSRIMDSVVSWNHVIKHHMDKGQIKLAFKTYNEMKKRAVKPDSHTYTLILNGLSAYTHFNQTLFRALQVYNSLSSPKSPVPPNVYHTNAILKVCARAGDLDSMWNIVGKLPMKGQNAPNTVTYTTLLNGIGTDRSTNKANDVEDGRRVWAGVISRWTMGQLSIDEELACAMGTVLLKGERREDWEEVFTLVEQVFGIKSLVPERLSKPITSDSIYLGGAPNPITKHSISAPAATEDPKSTPQVSDVEKLLTPFVTYRHHSHSQNPVSSTRPSPGNQTLSLILRACTNLKDHVMAFKYWTIFTNRPYSVIPDLENYHDLLRILRRFRSGPEALSVVESMRVRPTAKTFYIALSSCKRGGRSKNFLSAEKLLSLMTSKYGIPPDVKIWNMFLQCAVKSEDPAHIKQALRQIDENFNMTVELGGRRASPIYLERALELLRAMISAVDVLMDGGQRIGVRWGHGERGNFEDRKKELQKLLLMHGGRAARRSYRVDMEQDD